MQFLFPIGLLALLSLPLIIVLHIIRERRRRQLVPSLQHWRSLPRPKEGRQLSRLPLTLLLALQLLIAALLALALAQPQLAGRPLQRASQTALVLDTSTSMAAREGGTSRFEQARGQALARVAGLTAGDKLTLIAAGPTPRVIGSGMASDRVQLETVLRGLQPGGAIADLAPALALAEAVLDTKQPGQIIVLTDVSATPPVARTTTAPVEWVQLGNEQNNRAIIGFAARPAGGKVEVYARVANYGGAGFDGNLRLFVDDAPVDARPVQIAANAEAEQTWTLPASGSALRLALDGNDALPADDTALVSLTTTRPLKLVLVTNNEEPLRRALVAVPGAQVQVVAPASYSAALDADVTVFDSFLPEGWPEGAALAVNPPEGAALLNAGSSIDLTGRDLEQRGALVAGLGFGGVSFRTARVVTAPEGAQIILSAGDTPLILRGRSGANELAIWTFDLRASNIATRLAFPLLVNRTVRDLAPAALPAAIQAGTPFTMRPDPQATTVDLVAPDGTTQQFATGASISLDTAVEPGWYTVIERGATGERFRGRLAVNAGTLLESDLRKQQPPTLSALHAVGSAALSRQVTDLWPWLALFVLLALALEWGYVHVRR